MSGVVWSNPPEQAFVDLYDAYERAIYQAVWAICTRRAPEIENWLKENAPWTDRTGNARQTLWTDVAAAAGEIIITLSHGMTYGFWLEVAHTGRYAVLTPAMDYWVPIILRDIQELLR